MNGLWWTQTILTFVEIAGVFWGVRHILRERIGISRRYFWMICIGILAGLTVYQRTYSMYSRWWLIITLLFCIIIDCAYQKEKTGVWIFQALYFETLYCLDIFIYIFFFFFCDEQNFLADQHAIRPMRIMIYLISRGIVACGMSLLYKNRGKAVQHLKNGKLMWGIVAILEHFSLIICDRIFIPGMESRSIDGWKAMLFFYPFLFTILVTLIILQRYRMTYTQIGFQNELYVKQFQAMEKEYREKERIYHDFRNHLIVLQGMISDGESYQAQGYLEKLLVTGKKGESRTGVPALDYLIQVKAAEAESWNIEVREQYDEKFPHIDEEGIMDWCVLLGNLWDNALEGCRRVEGRTGIRFSLRREGKAIAVKMENSCLANLDTKHLITMKADRGMHGVGLKNIDYVVSKYDGKIERGCKDGVFTTQIIIIL